MESTCLVLKNASEFDQWSWVQVVGVAVAVGVGVGVSNITN